MTPVRHEADRILGHDIPFGKSQDQALYSALAMSGSDVFQPFKLAMKDPRKVGRSLHSYAAVLHP